MQFYLFTTLVIDCGDAPFKKELKDGEITLPVNRTTYFGSTIKYKCNEGFSLVGISGDTNVCQKDGKWSSQSTPECLCKQIFLYSSLTAFKQYFPDDTFLYTFS